MRRTCNFTRLTGAPDASNAHSHFFSPTCKNGRNIIVYEMRDGDQNILLKKPLPSEILVSSENSSESPKVRKSRLQFNLRSPRHPGILSSSPRSLSDRTRSAQKYSFISTIRTSYDSKRYINTSRKYTIFKNQKRNEISMTHYQKENTQRQKKRRKKGIKNITKKTKTIINEYLQEAEDGLKNGILDDKREKV